MDFEVPFSATSTLEQLPGGVWLRASHPEALTSEYRRWLREWLGSAGGRITVVLGHPGGPPVPAADVIAFWELLHDESRASVRFLSLTAASSTGGAAAGQILADLVGQSVVVWAGVPVGSQDSADGITVRLLRANGSLGMPTFARELGYRPAAPGARNPPPPAVVGCQAPFAGLTELSRGVYKVTDDAAVEVIQSGLWLRPLDEPPGGDAVRRQLADPGQPVILFHAVNGTAERMRRLADGIRAVLDAELGAACQVQPATQDSQEISERQEAAAPWHNAGYLRRSVVDIPLPADDIVPTDEILVGHEATESPAHADRQELVQARPPVSRPAIRLESGPVADAGNEAVLAALDGPPSGTGLLAANQPAAPAAAAAEAAVPAYKAAPGDGADPAVAVQVTPSPEACIIPPQRGISSERAWLRRAMSQQHHAASNSVLRVLAESPGLRGPAGSGGTAQADLLTDLVAVRLYLTGAAQDLDDAVRSGEVGPHVPFGRCVAAGLRRMPSYRGPARLCATLTDAEWEWYTGQRTITEWAFCPALANGRTRLPGTVDFLIWSMTARQASLLDPSARGQVLFLPGTSFKVLRVTTEGRRAVLLREISAAEIGPDGRVHDSRAQDGRVPLDEIALAACDKATASWAQDQADEDLPEAYADRFASPPGLLMAGIAVEPDGPGIDPAPVPAVG